MINFSSPRWTIAKGFLISMAVFQVLLWLLLLPKGLMPATMSAVIAPFLPPAFALFELGRTLRGSNAIQVVLGCAAAIIAVTLSIKYATNRFVLLAAHVSLIVYWFMCFALLGI